MKKSIYKIQILRPVFALFLIYCINLPVFATFYSNQNLIAQIAQPSNNLPQTNNHNTSIFNSTKCSSTSGSSDFYFKNSSFSTNNSSLSSHSTSDLNNNSNIDLSLTSSTSNSINNFLGDGKGGFSVATPTNTSSITSFMFPSDINDDNLKDILLLSKSSNKFSILVNDGELGFHESISFEGLNSPSQISTGDVNNDGFIDSFVLDNDALYLYLNFGEPDTYLFGFPLTLPFIPKYFTLADINNDGNLDIICPDPSSSQIVILYGNGFAEFNNQYLIPTNGKPSSVYIADLNNDSKLDLIASLPNKLAVVFSNTSVTNFDNPIYLNTPSNSLFINVANLNGDCLPDIVSANDNKTFSILKNNGGKSFSPSVEFSLTSNPISFSISDLNNDSRSDLIFAFNNEIKIYLASDPPNDSESELPINCIGGRPVCANNITPECTSNGNPLCGKIGGITKYGCLTNGKITFDNISCPKLQSTSSSGTTSTSSSSSGSLASIKTDPINCVGGKPKCTNDTIAKCSSGGNPICGVIAGTIRYGCISNGKILLDVAYCENTPTNTSSSSSSGTTMSSTSSSSSSGTTMSSTSSSSSSGTTMSSTSSSSSSGTTMSSTSSSSSSGTTMSSTSSSSSGSQIVPTASATPKPDPCITTSCTSIPFGMTGFYNSFTYDIDINGDGKLDTFTKETFGDLSLTINGVKTTLGNIGSANITRSICTADLDKDGYKDLLVTNGDCGGDVCSTIGFSWVQNKNNSTFTLKKLNVLFGLSNTSSFKVDDYNNDGYTDILSTPQFGNNLQLISNAFVTPTLINNYTSINSCKCLCNTSSSSGSLSTACKIEDSNFMSQDGGCKQTETGVIWGLSKSIEGYQAASYCQELIANTFDDWRLPSYNELTSLINLNGLNLQLPITLWSDKYVTGNSQLIQTVTLGNSSTTGTANVFDINTALCVRGDYYNPQLLVNKNNLCTYNFTGPVESTTLSGSLNNNIVSADFDNDGIVDLCTVQSTTVSQTANYNVTINFTKGNGGSFGFPIISSFTDSVNVLQVEAKDINNDSNQDIILVVSKANDYEVRILTGQGNGKFNAPITLTSISAIQITDINNDNKLDIVGTSISNKAISYINNGALSFTRKESPTTATITSNPVSVGDFNNDGFKDLDILNPSKNNISILKGKGDGTFSDLNSYVTGEQSLSIINGDFNNDGNLDIVTASISSSGEISLLLGNGDGSFKLPRKGLVGVINKILKCDANNDGNLDFAAIYANGNFGVFEGNGKGNFSNPAGYYYEGKRLQFFTVNDFDNDGLLDVAYLTEQGQRAIYLLWNKTTCRPDTSSSSGCPPTPNCPPSPGNTYTNIPMSGECKLGCGTLKACNALQGVLNAEGNGLLTITGPTIQANGDYIFTGTSSQTVIENGISVTSNYTADITVHPASETFNATLTRIKKGFTETMSVPGTLKCPGNFNTFVSFTGNSMLNVNAQNTYFELWFNYQAPPTTSSSSSSSSSSGSSIIIPTTQAVNPCKVESNEFQTSEGGCKQLQTGYVFNKPFNDINYNQSYNFCENLTVNGYDDWKLISDTEYRAVSGDNALKYFNFDTFNRFFLSTGMIAQDTQNTYITDIMLSDGPGYLSSSLSSALRTALCVRRGSTSTSNSSSSGSIIMSSSSSSSGSTVPFISCKKEDAVFKSQNGGCQNLATNLVWSGIQKTSPNQQDAINTCNNLTLNGFDDWILPTALQITDVALRYAPDYLNYITNQLFWSSSVNSNTGVIANLSNTSQYLANASTSYPVVCIRTAPTPTTPTEYDPDIYVEAEPGCIIEKCLFAQRPRLTALPDSQLCQPGIRCSNSPYTQYYCCPALNTSSSSSSSGTSSQSTPVNCITSNWNCAAFGECSTSTCSQSRTCTLNNNTCLNPENVKPATTRACSPTTYGKSWTLEGALPQGVFNSDAVVFNGKIFVIGGRRFVGTTSSEALNKVYVSSDGANWQEAKNQTGQDPLPEGLSYHSAVVFKNKIWSFGGNNSTNSFSNKIYSSTDGYNWITENSVIPVSVYAHKVVEFNNKLYLIGGSISGTGISKQVYSSTDGLNWVREADLYSAVTGHSATLLNGKVLIFGGYTLTSTGSSQQNSSTQTLELGSQGVYSSTLSSSFVYLNGEYEDAIVADNKIWYLHGNKPSQSADGLTWFTLPVDFPNIVWRYSTVYFKNKLFVISGLKGPANNQVITGEVYSTQADPNVTITCNSSSSSSGSTTSTSSSSSGLISMSTSSSSSSGSFICSQSNPCQMGMCTNGSTYQKYSCTSGSCIQINYLVDPCSSSGSSSSSSGSISTSSSGSSSQTTCIINQWASDASASNSYSSNPASGASASNSSSSYPASYIVGAPDCTSYNNCPTYKVWFSATAGQSATVDLTFSTPTLANSVLIKESFYPGFVKKITLKDQNNNIIGSPINVSDTSATTNGDLLVSFPKTSILVSKVSIDTTPTSSTLYSSIDAVQLGCSSSSSTSSSSGSPTSTSSSSSGSITMSSSSSSSGSPTSTSSSSSGSITMSSSSSSSGSTNSTTSSSSSGSTITTSSSSSSGSINLCKAESDRFKSLYGGCTDLLTMVVYSQSKYTNSWSYADTYCTNLIESGFDDWRLPSENEFAAYGGSTLANDYFKFSAFAHYWLSNVHPVLTTLHLGLRPSDNNEVADTNYKAIVCVRTAPNTPSSTSSSSSGSTSQTQNVLSFTAQTPIGVTDINRGIKSFDYDKDGKQDIILIQANSRVSNTNTYAQYSLIRGKGDGTFFTPTYMVLSYAIPSYIYKEDFNNDGDQDLVLASSAAAFGLQDYNLSSLDNNNSGFTEVGTIGAGIIDISFADINLDGKKDIAAINPNNQILILNGDNAGAFNSVYTKTLGRTNATVGYYSAKIATGKFNNDNYTDIAIVYPNYDSISVLLGNSSGTFGQETYFSTGKKAFDLEVKDVNQDGYLDIVTINDKVTTTPTQPCSISVLLGAGNGSFSSAITSPLSDGNFTGKEILVEDYDGDSKPDVVILGRFENKIYILKGDGLGNFTNPQSYIFNNLSDQSVSISSSDFNGDGKLDISVATTNNSTNNERVTVLLNTSFATTTPVANITSLSANSGPATTPIMINGSNFSNVSSVRFGNTPATFTVNSSTLITAAPPTGTGTVGITVTSNNITSNSVDFTYSSTSSSSGSSTIQANITSATLVNNYLNLAYTKNFAGCVILKDSNNNNIIKDSAPSYNKPCSNNETLIIPSTDLITLPQENSLLKLCNESGECGPPVSVLKASCTNSEITCTNGKLAYCPSAYPDKSCSSNSPQCCIQNQSGTTTCSSQVLCNPNISGSTSISTSTSGNTTASGTCICTNGGIGCQGCTYPCPDTYYPSCQSGQVKCCTGGNNQNGVNIPLTCIDYSCMLNPYSAPSSTTSSPTSTGASNSGTTPADACKANDKYFIASEGGCKSLKKSLVFSKVPNFSYSLANAKSYCTNLVENGFDDWRLPELEELSGVARSTNILLVKEPFISTYSGPGFLDNTAGITDFWTNTLNSIYNLPARYKYGLNDSTNTVNGFVCVRNGSNAIPNDGFGSAASVCKKTDVAFKSQNGGCEQTNALLATVWSNRSPTKLGFNDAEAYCSNLVEGGKNDWFFPDTQTLYAFAVNYAKTYLNFDTNDLYWSRQLTPSFANQHVTVNLYSAAQNTQTNINTPAYVVCMRQYNSYNSTSTTSSSGGTENTTSSSGTVFTTISSSSCQPLVTQHTALKYPLTMVLSDGAAVWDDSRFIILGGLEDNSVSTKYAYIYDQSVPWVYAASNLPSEYAANGLYDNAAIYDSVNKKSYTIGGSSIYYGQNFMGYASIYSYDVNSLFQYKNTLPNQLNGTCAVFNEYDSNLAGPAIYILGGNISNLRTKSRSVYIYDINKNSIQEIKDILPTGRSHHACAYNPDNKKAYILGGYDGTNNLKDILEFDTVTNMIQTSQLSLPTETSHITAHYDLRSMTIIIPESNLILDPTYRTVSHFNGATNTLSAYDKSKNRIINYGSPFTEISTTNCTDTRTTTSSTNNPTSSSSSDSLGVSYSGLGQCSSEDNSFKSLDGGCKDIYTGLVWSQPSIQPASTVLFRCLGFGQGNFTDWRPPTIEELNSFYNRSGLPHLAYVTTPSGALENIGSSTLDPIDSGNRTIKTLVPSTGAINGLNLSNYASTQLKSLCVRQSPSYNINMCESESSTSTTLSNGCYNNSTMTLVTNYRKKNFSDTPCLPYSQVGLKTTEFTTPALFTYDFEHTYACSMSYTPEISTSSSSGSNNNCGAEGQVCCRASVTSEGTCSNNLMCDGNNNRCGNQIHYCSLTDERFSIEDGGCKDATVGVVWSKLGPRYTSVSAATTYCTNNREGGFNDWRLPEAGEVTYLGYEGSSHFGFPTTGYRVLNSVESFVPIEIWTSSVYQEKDAYNHTYTLSQVGKLTNGSVTTWSSSNPNSALGYNTICVRKTAATSTSNKVETCTDSDNGTDYLARGKVKSSKESYSYTDSCILSGANGQDVPVSSCEGNNCYLNEYSCDGNSERVTEKKPCAECSNGRCKLTANNITVVNPPAPKYSSKNITLYELPISTPITNGTISTINNKGYIFSNVNGANAIFRFNPSKNYSFENIKTFDSNFEIGNSLSFNDNIIVLGKDKTTNTSKIFKYDPFLDTSSFEAVTTPRFNSTLSRNGNVLTLLGGYTNYQKTTVATNAVNYDDTSFTQDNSQYFTKVNAVPLNDLSPGRVLGGTDPNVSTSEKDIFEYTNSNQNTGYGYLMILSEKFPINLNNGVAFLDSTTWYRIIIATINAGKLEFYNYSIYPSVSIEKISEADNLPGNINKIIGFHRDENTNNTYIIGYSSTTNKNYIIEFCTNCFTSQTITQQNTPSSGTTSTNTSSSGSTSASIAPTTSLSSTSSSSTSTNSTTTCPAGKIFCGSTCITGNCCSLNSCTNGQVCSNNSCTTLNYLALTPISLESTSSQVGSQIRYRINIFNKQSVAQSKISVSFPKPHTSWTVDTFATNATCSLSGNNVICNNINLAANNGRNIDFYFDIPNNFTCNNTTIYKSIPFAYSPASPTIIYGPEFKTTIPCQ